MGSSFVNRFFLSVPFLLWMGQVTYGQPTSIPSPQSEWVFAKGSKLVYKATEKGDRIMDFSHAGYMGGGVSIPEPTATITVKPGEDDAARIQEAIDNISKKPVVNGFRGVVLLSPGTYHCERTININSGGIVLRGSGSGENGTVLNLTGKPHNCVAVRGQVTYSTSGVSAKVHGYVPSGSLSFNVNDARQFKPGDSIRISKPVTEKWVAFMGMHQLVRDGKKQTWISGTITTDRVITRVSGNSITVDVPLTDNYDPAFLDPPGVTVEKVSSSGMIEQVGLENFRIVSPKQSGTINEGHHRAFTMSGIADGWARNIEVFNTVNSISVTGKRITVDNVNIHHDVATEGAAKPADLNGSGQQLLFNKCSITGDNLFFFGTGAKVTGPVVVLNCVFRGNGWIQPHQRWATGLLIDGCEVPDGGIDFMNRGVMGSGHGWTIGWAVAWNCRAKSYLNQQPPGAANWVIGSIGEKQKRAIPFDKEPFLPEGLYDSHGTAVNPESLYLAQLAERLGHKAVKNIGY